MEHTIVKNGIYRHYKGGVYRVVDFARHSESLEELVIYKNVETGDCWARPIGMWNETVLYNGAELPRFQLQAAEPEPIPTADPKKKMSL